jgi:uncharacterized membrane protein YidH (DUF202 family)
MLINIAYASESLDQFMNNVDKLIINPLILLLFALAVVYFLYGLVEFILNGENEEKKTTGKMHMLWGVIGITIMMGVFFLMNLILNTFDIQGINVEQRTVNLPPAP